MYIDTLYPKLSISMFFRHNQSLKGAVVVTHCQNEAEVKFQMEIDRHISPTEQAGKMRLISVDEIWRSISN